MRPAETGHGHRPPAAEPRPGRALHASQRPLLGGEGVECTVALTAVVLPTFESSTIRITKTGNHRLRQLPNEGSRPAMYTRIPHAYLHLSHQLHAEGR
jgi:hypothetical protein